MFVTKEMCEAAVASISPGLEMAIEQGEHDGIALVFMRSAGREVIYAPTFGNKNQWEGPFDRCALAKAELTAEHGISISRIRQRDPTLLHHPEFGKIHNGSVFHKGLIIAGAGAGGRRGDVIIVYQLLAYVKKAVEEQPLIAA